MSLFNTRKAESRKERSEKFLLSQRVQINPNLPEIANEADAELKSPDEAAKRAVTAFLTAQIAIDICNGETVRNPRSSSPISYGSLVWITSLPPTRRNISRSPTNVRRAFLPRTRISFNGALRCVCRYSGRAAF